MNRAVRLLFHARHAYSGRERNDQLVPRRRSDSGHHVQNDARLHPDQNYFRLLCDLGVFCGYRNSQLLVRSAVRATSCGSLTMISAGAQNFARTRPRMTEPASLPPPIKPSRYRLSLDCKLMGWADIKRWSALV